MNVTCIILAAGASRRFGRNKLVEPMPGGTLLERAIRACAAFPTIAVCSTQTAARASQDSAEVVVNDRPELGMAHSLRLANGRVDRSHHIVILPADLALIEARDVEMVVSQCAGADVTFPARADGLGGHPVVLSPHARREIAALAPGEPIRTLRDRMNLTRAILRIDDPWPYRDVDCESDLSSL
jgi:molybdenum cofactor cytidylyltransferase